jgi:hypothetical protein
MPTEIKAELKERVRKIYGCNDNVSNYLIKSGGSVEFTPKKSEIKSKL